jgi:hypothetical protein
MSASAPSACTTPASVARSAARLGRPGCAGRAKTNTGTECGWFSIAARKAAIRRGPTVNTITAAGWPLAQRARVSRRTASFGTKTFFSRSPPRSTSIATAASVSPFAPSRSASRSGIAVGRSAASRSRNPQQGVASTRCLQASAAWSNHRGRQARSRSDGCWPSLLFWCEHFVSRPRCSASCSARIKRRRRARDEAPACRRISTERRDGRSSLLLLRS